MKSRFIAASLVLWCVAAMAETAFDGSWVLEWIFTPTGQKVSASVEIRDGVGTWKDRVLWAERENNCIKVTAPVRVERRSNPDRHVLVMDRRKALPGCEFLVMEIAAQPDGGVTAHWRNGNPVTWTKK